MRMKSPRRLLFAIILAVVAALIAAGCGSDDDSGAAETATAPVEKQTVTIALDWVPNTNHTGIYVAKVQGFFEKQGLDVKILPYSGASTDVLVSQGKADLGVSFVPSVLVSRAAGIEVKSVAAIMSKNTEALVVLEDSKYKSPKDLATGTTYGGFGLPYETPLWTAILKADGATKVDFKNATLNTAAYEAVYQKKVDWSALFLGWEAIEAEERGVKLRLFPFTDYIGEAGNYPSVVFVASDEAIAGKAELLKKALAALDEGYTYASTNPAESAQIMIDENPELQKNTTLVQKSAEYLAPIYAPEGVWGQQKEAAFTGLGDLLLEGGALTGPDKKPLTTADFTEYFTNDLLPAD